MSTAQCAISVASLMGLPAMRIDAMLLSGRRWIGLKFFFFWLRELAQRSRLETARAQRAQPGHTKGTVWA